jgi:hypothetical protein
MHIIIIASRVVYDLSFAARATEKRTFSRFPFFPLLRAIFLVARPPAEQQPFEYHAISDLRFVLQRAFTSTCKKLHDVIRRQDTDWINSATHSAEENHKYLQRSSSTQHTPL